MSSVASWLLHIKALNAHLHITLVESARHNEHHIVNHMPISAIVHELTQGFIRLQGQSTGHKTQHLLSAEQAP